MQRGKKGWEWAGMGEVFAKALVDKWRMARFLTHQSDMSKNVTADVM